MINLNCCICRVLLFEKSCLKADVHLDCTHENDGFSLRELKGLKGY